MSTPNVAGVRWRKSTRSNGTGACLEVGIADSVAGVRDTKLGEASPVLVFPRTQWSNFVHALKAGDLDSSD